VWTTAPDTDVCTEYEKRQAPEFSLFDSQSACAQWVRERRCRPGMSCNDGCNDLGCDATGMHLRSTLLACELRVTLDAIEFLPKSRQLTTQLDWDDAVERLKKQLRLPARKLKIIGFALPSEAASPSAVKELARQRAEMVARAFGSRGIERSRLLPIVGDPSTLGVEGYRVGRVYLQLDPDQLEPEEYDPTSPGYAELCWVKYPRSQSGGEAPTDGASGPAAQ
jgi:hypothetical protein